LPKLGGIRLVPQVAERALLLRRWRIRVVGNIGDLPKQVRQPSNRNAPRGELRILVLLLV
jgi:hypothetical protein